MPPAEIEAVLLLHPGVSDSGVIGVTPDIDLHPLAIGEVPRAYIVREPGQEVTEDEIHAFIKGTI